ncbi:MAG: hypothetical protein QXD04_02430 [Candidatus Bathyarchaeia archaeon]
MGSRYMNLTALLIQILAGIIVVAPALWLSGRALVGKERAKFTDAISIVIIGQLLGAVVNSLLSGLIAAIIMLIVWLALIKHFFDCGWLKAFLIALIAVIIFIVIIAILGLIGLGILGFL